MLEIQSKIGLWAFHRLEYLNGSIGITPKPWSRKLELIQVSILELLAPRCWEKGCKSHAEPCLLRGYYDDDDEDRIYWYCGEHSQKHGFCFSCGEFWGGAESFDFGPGYCSNCASEFEEEEYDEPEWTYEL